MSPATAIVKEKAKKFLRHLLEDKDDQKPPSKPSFPSEESGLVHSFNSLALSNKPNHPSPEFVGGFHLPCAPTKPSESGSAPSPHPAPIPHTSPPGKYSLTMQMALRPEDYNLPSSTIPQSSFQQSAMPSNTTAMIPNPETSSPALTPQKPTSSNSTSQSSSPQVFTNSQQCAGLTKSGKRCTRQVKSRPALFHALENANHPDFRDQPIELFCFQHSKELMGPSGFYARKNGVWVNFQDWIPAYLQSDTQVALRVEMEKSRSQSDVDGYIYTFEIRGSCDEEISLKVGRAVNLVKRIDQWGKQCGSKEQVLRGWYPGVVEPENSESSLMKGRIKAGEKAPWCHRMERLIHLELADLLATGVYRDPAWPHPQTSSANVKSSSSKAKKTETCADCGTIHKEIFTFQRISGKHKGKEWEIIVQPVIERWGAFVSQFV